MRLEEMERVAGEVVEMLAPYCEQIQVAGSVRRRKAEPKDVEIVYRAEMVSGGLFDAVEFDFLAEPATEGAVSELCRQGFWRFDPEVRRNGPKHKRLIHAASGVVVELFRAEEGNWGVILALRTGPKEFNRVFVSKPWHGGAMPIDMAMREGWLWRLGQRLETPTEEGFFEALGLPWWEPEGRTGERLVRWLERGLQDDNG